MIQTNSVIFVKKQIPFVVASMLLLMGTQQLHVRASGDDVSYLEEEEEVQPNWNGVVCSEHDNSCTDCLNNFCAYVPFVGCLNSCDVIADTSCYAPEFWEYKKSNKEICEIAAEEEGSNKKEVAPRPCGEYDDSCTDCLDNYCAYVPFVGCLDSCDVIADTSCYAPEFWEYQKSNAEICEIAAQEELNNDDEVAPRPCGDYDGSCRGCVDNLCSWIPGHGCLESCDEVADASCYSFETFPSGSTTQEMCDTKKTNRRDERLCGRNKDCASCVETTLSDGINTCQWFPNNDDDGIAAGGGYCGSECGMWGCGDFVCR